MELTIVGLCFVMKRELNLIRDLSLNSSSATAYMSNLKQVICPLGASVPSSVKGGYWNRWLLEGPFLV